MTIYTITYNEELMLPHFIKHYRDRFPECEIIIYDNMSTDRTTEIALENNCKVILYDTNNQLSDTTYLKIKNNCWKGQNDWVIIADCDELIDIDADDLLMIQYYSYNMVQGEGYNMVNHNDDLDIDSITNGVRSKSYDKIYCFNASEIEEINYEAGAHFCTPKAKEGHTIEKFPYKSNTYHFKYINIDYMIERHGVFASRLSEENKLRGFGAHYLYSPEQIKNEFLEARKQSKSIL